MLLSLGRIILHLPPAWWNYPYSQVHIIQKGVEQASLCRPEGSLGGGVSLFLHPVSSRSPDVTGSALVCSSAGSLFGTQAYLLARFSNIR